MKIKKRNGLLEEFNESKIINAVNKATIEVVGKPLTDLGKLVSKIVTPQCNEGIDVESIQDLVIKTLLGLGKIDIATHYIGYRATQAYKRNISLQKLYDKMGDVIEYGDNENANKNYKMQSVIRDTIAGEYFRETLFRKLPSDIADAHITKAIHWHDSDVDTKYTNCCLFNVYDMLQNGTKINNADVEKPNSVGTAMNIAMQIMASISSQQYGGISLPNFNEVFAEYAKINFKKNFIKAYSANMLSNNITIEEFEKETQLIIDSSNEKLKNGTFKKIYEIAKKWTKKDIYDACQLFEYQTNSVLGSASQTPFSTITFNIPTSWESEEIISAYLDVRMKGLGKKCITAIFPKLSMIVVDGYNLKETDPYYWLLEKASKCIAKTYYPDILNYTKEDYDNGTYYARMGCRSRVNHEFRDENGKPAQYGRFNYGVVTLNLPQIALKALKKYDNKSERISEFFNILNTFGYDIMKKSLMQRYEFVKVLKAKEAPILFQYGGITRLEPEETIEPLLKTDRASVSYGFLGIDDCVRLLTEDKENISTKIGQTLGLEIMTTIRKQADRIKKETDLPVSVYGSPVEASIYNMWKEDRKNFDDVMPQWLKDREYYTNSFHFSSELPIDSFEKIEIESKFIPYCNGGNISYVENSGKAINNEAIIELIQYAYKQGTQYFAINTITDVCYKCGYTGEITYLEDEAKYVCPHCGNTDGREMKVQRRCCGYISNYAITHGVKGRMKEINHRVKHI